MTFTRTVALLINFADKGKNPTIATCRTVLSYLQDHYPERLGLSIFINVPFIVTTTLKIIMPFVDPITREKVKFNPDIFGDGIFTPDMVMKEWWGGSQDFEYAHEKYWPNLIELCETRVKGWMKNWRDLGGKVGTKEWEYKQGVVKHEETNEKKEIIITIDAPAEVGEVLEKEVKLLPTVDITEPAEQAVHHAEDEGQSVAMASADGAITGGAEGVNDGGFDVGHGGDVGGD